MARLERTLRRALASPGTRCEDGTRVLDGGAVGLALEGILAMLERVVSGGQTDADQAGWRAARAFGIPTGGWMPKGFLTENGPRPDFADQYGARELPTSSYPERTFANVRDSDATLWFGDASTPGARATIEACHKLSRSCLRVEEGFTRPSHVAAWIIEHKVRVLNIAGSRESKAPGIGARIERFLADVFRRLGHRMI